MPNKLRHERGGYYAYDPARYQRRDDFLVPDDPLPKRKAKKGRRRRSYDKRRQEQLQNQTKETCFAQAELLIYLKYPKSRKSGKRYGAFLKDLRDKEILLENGMPNHSHPVVRDAYKWFLKNRQ